MNALRSLTPNAITPLPADGRYEYSAHRWSLPEIDALTLALAARRPLLVRGEPGIGKTQIARAVAVHLGWRLHSETIHPRFDPEHLIARFDAVRRLADAQAQKLGEDSDYWSPGPLWRAYDWAGAERFKSVSAPIAQPVAEPDGHVILIDEIDKADSDLPNSLLELLGQRSLAFAPLKLQLGGPDARLPLVIITTNEERELPAAFIRRCVVLNLAAPEDYRGWLIERGRTHYPGGDRAMHETVLALAADDLIDDRSTMKQADLPPPGAAEYLDLLSALHDLAARDTAAQLKLIEKLSLYAYFKHSVRPSPRRQSRDPIASDPS
ncbi:AAA family ATPase [Aquimonas sp.]|jgi:MoxR-like ATPase|uniref:AAA family ATPase n=1 Tax=Aquimonas sp. TaxID=1872588 RepID=UPI0037C16163